jgi:hypothetical protein
MGWHATKVLAGVTGVLAVVLTGCAATPESTFNDMKKAACKSDVQGFFSHVDKTKVADSITEAALARAAAGAPKGGLAGAGAKLGGQLAKSMMPAVVAAAFTGWEDDIKKGEAGDLCYMTFERAEAGEQTASVAWKTHSGTAKVYEFTRFGDKWLVVGVK